MVWGMREPNRFGEFFPDAGFVGWREGLREWFETEASESERARYNNRDATYIHNVAEKFTSEIGVTRLNGSPALTPLIPREFPDTLKSEKSYKSLGDLIMVDAGLLVVSSGMRDIIESLESNIHIFWPIRILMPKGVEFPKSFYAMVVGQFLDSFRPNASDPEFYREVSSGSLYSGKKHDKKDCLSRLAMAREAFDGAHLWRERRLYSPNIFLSDELQGAIKQAGLRIPKHYHMREV